MDISRRRGDWEGEAREVVPTAHSLICSDIWVRYLATDEDKPFA
jgi:hypothetical protein